MKWAERKINIFTNTIIEYIISRERIMDPVANPIARGGDIEWLN